MKIVHVTPHLPPDQAANALLPFQLGEWARARGDTATFVSNPPVASPADPRAGVERMIDAIEVVMPGTRSRVAHAKLYRHVEGYPVFYSGYLQHLKNFPPYAVPRVMLAGDYLVSPTIEGALRSGERAALRLFDQVRVL